MFVLEGRIVPNSFSGVPVSPGHPESERFASRKWFGRVLANHTYFYIIVRPCYNPGVSINLVTLTSGTIRRALPFVGVVRVV